MGRYVEHQFTVYTHYNISYANICILRTFQKELLFHVVTGHTAATTEDNTTKRDGISRSIKCTTSTGDVVSILIWDFSPIIKCQKCFSSKQRGEWVPCAACKVYAIS